MAWRDRLLPASFRGVRFEVQAHENAGGRRLQTHEYPGREEPHTEDLGRRVREFSVEAYIVGDDYMERRDALLDACEKPGPGTLIHPYRGERQVACARYRLSERLSEGRMCRIALELVEAGRNRYRRPDARRAARRGRTGARAHCARGPVPFRGGAMTTPSRKQLADRLAALDEFLKAAAVVELARRVAVTRFADRQSAIEARDRAGELLDDVADEADTAAFRSYRGLRSAVVSHVAEAVRDLPTATEATPAAIRPSLALAYDIYDDIDRAGEIAARNRLPRPGFVPSRPIELLSS